MHCLMKVAFAGFMQNDHAEEYFWGLISRLTDGQLLKGKNKTHWHRELNIYIKWCD